MEVCHKCLESIDKLDRAVRIYLFCQSNPELLRIFIQEQYICINDGRAFSVADMATKYVILEDMLIFIRSVLRQQ